MRSWLKAGLIGGGALVVLTALSNTAWFVPLGLGSAISCCVCFPFFLGYLVIGIVAVLWLKPPRAVGQGAGVGALAGLVAGGVAGVFSALLNVVLGLSGAPERYLDRLPAETFYAFQDVGLDVLVTPAGWMILTLCAFLISLVWAVGSGALGGVIYAAAKRE